MTVQLIDPDADDRERDAKCNLRDDVSSREKGGRFDTTPMKA
jgi:hypothetical protein